MRGLKALVIFMGVLIVAGVIVLVVAAVDRVGDGGGSAFAPQAVDLPPGAEVVETRIGDGRIVLRLRLADGSGRLLVLDAATGHVAGVVDLERR